MMPPKEPVLPFVEMPRPLQESDVIGKGGTGRLPGQGLRSLSLVSGPNKPIRLDDLTLRKEVLRSA